MRRAVDSYRAILSVSAAWRFSLAGFLARLYRVGMVVGVVILLTGQGFGFSTAGLASAAIIVGGAIGGPAWARAADRLGQRGVAAAAGAAALAAATVFTIAVAVRAPALLIVTAAVLIGLATADGGSFARARWMHLLSDRDQRHTALALETALDELGFLIGLPLLTTVAALAPFGGLITAAALGAVGFVGLSALRSTAPAPAGPERGAAPGTGWRGWLPVGVAPVIPIFLGVGALFGFINLLGVAVTVEAGVPAWSGAVIGALSVGAVAAGLAWGVVAGRVRPALRLPVAGVVFAVFTPALALAFDPVGFGLAALVAGFGLTPVMIAATAAIEERTPLETMTVAMTWPAVALSAGNAAASTVVGAGVDSVGPAGLWAMPFAIVAFVAMGVVTATLTRARRR